MTQIITHLLFRLFTKQRCEKSSEGAGRWQVLEFHPNLGTPPSGAGWKRTDPALSISDPGNDRQLISSFGISLIISACHSTSLWLHSQLAPPQSRSPKSRRKAVESGPRRWHHQAEALTPSAAGPGGMAIPSRCSGQALAMSCRSVQNSRAAASLPHSNSLRAFSCMVVGRTAQHICAQDHRFGGFSLILRSSGRREIPHRFENPQSGSFAAIKMALPKAPWSAVAPATAFRPEFKAAASLPHPRAASPCSGAVPSLHSGQALSTENARGDTGATARYSIG